MHRYYASFFKAPQYASKVGYVHNQVAIEGRFNGKRCAIVHLASAYPNSLYLNDIELGNPNFPIAEERQLDPSQKYAGIGNGVFQEVLIRTGALAAHYGYEEVIAFAADDVRAKIFSRKGFSVDKRDKELYQWSLRTHVQVPIVMPVRVEGPEADRGGA